MSETRERNDTGHLSMRGEDTSPDITQECRDASCDQHYVVRLDGTWVRAFHDESAAWDFLDDARRLINR